MIIRVVRMKFTKSEAPIFLEIYKANEAAIKGAPGCISVQLLRDVEQPNCWYTLSQWDSAHDLENYRKSELFGTVWKQVKPLFAAPADAFSME